MLPKHYPPGGDRQATHAGAYLWHPIPAVDCQRCFVAPGDSPDPAAKDHQPGGLGFLDPPTHPATARDG